VRWGSVVARALLAVTLMAAACSGDADPPDTSAPAAPATTTTRPGDAEGTARWRPAAHYTPERNWMNDPNGLVHQDGTWHLFYQHNPRGIGPGNMSWVHATSTDLRPGPTSRWRSRPPTTSWRSPARWSPTATTRRGLGTADEPPLVAVYTGVYGEGSGLPANTQAQSLAYSTDGGTTWARYEGNPVLRLGEPEARSFRDPKVFWYEPGGYWVMVAVVAEAEGWAEVAEVADVELVVEPGTATRAGVAVHRSADGTTETRITYDPAAGTLSVDRSRSGDLGFSPRFTTVHEAEVPASAIEDGLDLRILLDRSSVEVFAAGGAVTLSELVLPPKGADRVALFAEGGTATFGDVTVRRTA
jgi:sucrose-6-phosphate hydrolase SacC (GH32 family)